MQDLEILIKAIITMQGIIIIAFIAQFIANITIIIQLPKIKHILENICFEEEENE